MAIQRTAQGKMVDMSQLAARNEKVRAVGNMNVNARGDIVDSHNRVIKDNTKRVKPSYQNVVGNKPEPTAPAAPKQAHQSFQADEPIELTEEEKELFDDDQEDVKK